MTQNIVKELLIYLAIDIDRFAVSVYVTEFTQNESDKTIYRSRFSPNKSKILDILHYKVYQLTKKELIAAEIKDIIESYNLKGSNFKKSTVYINNNNQIFNRNLSKLLKEQNLLKNITIYSNNQDYFVDEEKLKQDIILFKDYLNDKIINFNNDNDRQKLFNNFNFNKAKDLDYSDLRLLCIVEGAIYAKGDSGSTFAIATINL